MLVCAYSMSVFWHDYMLVCVCGCVYVCATAYLCVFSGKDAQHGAGQGPRRGSGSGQSLVADPTVRVFFCLCAIFRIILVLNYRCIHVIYLHEFYRSL